MTVAFIGDSQMANFTASGWQNQMIREYGMKLLPVPMNNGTGASKNSNLAQVGKTTTWMKNILSKFYSTWLFRPDILFIYGGGNDISNGISPESVVKNTQDMVDLARKYGTKHIYVIPGYRSSKVSLKAKAISESDAQLRDSYKQMLTTQIKGATVLPIWEQADSTYSSDGLHISDQAKLKQFSDFISKAIFVK